MTFGLPMSSITTTRRPSVRRCDFPLLSSVGACTLNAARRKTDGAKKEWGWRASSLNSTYHQSGTSYRRWLMYLKLLNYVPIFSFNGIRFLCFNASAANKLAVLV